MKKQITVLLIILGLSLMVVGCSDKDKDHEEAMQQAATEAFFQDVDINTTNDVPVP